jgi:hypothetical protein
LTRCPIGDRPIRSPQPPHALFDAHVEVAGQTVQGIEVFGRETRFRRGGDDRLGIALVPELGQV